MRFRTLVLRGAFHVDFSLAQTLARTHDAAYAATMRRCARRSPKTSAAALVGALVLSTSTLESRADEYRAPELGHAYGEFEGPRTVGMGGAARAFGQSTSAIPLNPANLATQSVYHFELLGGLDTKAHRLQYGAAILDAVTQKMAMGALVSRTDLGNDGDPYRRGTLDVRVAFAFPFGDRLAVGVGGHYLRATQDGTGLLGESPVSRSSSDATNYRGFTLDAGLNLLIAEGFRLGFVAQNLTNPGTVLAPLMFGGGLGFKKGDLTLEADVVGVDKVIWGSWKARLQAGVEFLAGDHYPLRIGWHYDQGSQRHSIHYGTGFVDRSFAIDVGVRQEIAAPANDPWGKTLVFAVGLRYFYDAATTGAPDNAGGGF